MRIDTELLEDPIILNWMRDSVLGNLVTSRNEDQYDLESKLALLKVNSTFYYPAVALFECSQSLSGASQREQELERIRAVIEESIPEGSVVFKDAENRIGLLFSWKFLAAVRWLAGGVYSSEVHPVTIGIGQPCFLLSNIHQSYEQAVLALQHKFYVGFGELIFFSEISPYESLQEYPIFSEKELFQRIKSATDIPDIERRIEEFYEQLLRKGRIGINQIHEMTIRLLAGMEKRMLGDARESSANLRYELMSIVKLETLSEVIHFVALYLSDILEGMMKEDRESHRNIIKKTIHHMEQECQIATLDSMARKVYMTPTYLSMLFKVNTGVTFIEQLTDIRIGKAKEMLKNTCLRNYEIAEQVGYHDSRYFSQLFKKRVGLSPSEYRNSVVE